VIKALLGGANVSAVPLQKLSENRFAPAELFGRLGNICGDLDARAIKQTDQFKMLTGGDPIFAERKHRDPFTFTSYALPIFSANEAPFSADQTEAWFDRWLIVPMEKRIEKVDPHMITQLTTCNELQGLLARAIGGLQRLMDRGRFDRPESVAQAGSAYRERLDSVRGFVSDECLLETTAWTKRADLYSAYHQWAQKGGRFPLSNATFYDRLRREYPERVVERTRNGKRGFAGIGLLTQELAE
jgi:putative DNA primase/helicase